MVAPLCNIINDMRLKLMALTLERGNQHKDETEPASSSLTPRLVERIAINQLLSQGLGP